ncbi:uncharacterized protein PAC_15186 [Phialocephala subalpina]|uniref:Uncharacterized protein n=1 Tax=Phialocephala subalpina TaxID=576137 RepID=A0A1L7XK27_9HELO|nr:uncharacterized protein PAC_15186 [Phialocephala subalpina]
MPPIRNEKCIATSQDNSFDLPYPSPPPTPRVTSLPTTTSPLPNIPHHLPSSTTSITHATSPTLPKTNTLAPPEPTSSVPDPSTFVDSPTSNHCPAQPAPYIQPLAPVSPILTPSAPRTDNAIQPAPSDAASSPQSPVTPNDATCLDYEELSFQGPDARSASTLNIFEALLYHGILAPTKASRDSKLRVAGALKLIRSIRDGNPRTNQLLITRKITSRDYEQLLAQVAKDQSLQEYFNDKLRFDYTHGDSELTIRMPGAVHEFVAGRIHDVIVEQRFIFKQRPGTRSALLAQSIQTRESTDIQFPTRFLAKSDKKSPDKSYGYKDCLYPALVIEVAWSQRPLPLALLAKRYIQRSKGEIRTVVAVKIEYQQTMGARAHFLVWYAGRPNKRGVIEVNSPNIETMFRDEEGQAVPAADLRLSLTDFVCSNVAHSFADVKDEIIISSNDLCDILAKAEKRQFPEAQATQSTTGSTSKGAEGAKTSANNTFSKVKGVVTKSMAKPPEPRKSARLHGDTEH